MRIRAGRAGYHCRMTQSRFKRLRSSKLATAGDEAKPAKAGPAVPKPPVVEFSVGELARTARTSVRNVRAYQDRGLIPPPERRGRKGVYGQEHLSRLRIIGQLLTRGYTLNSIGEMLQAWDQGHGLAELLGLETAVSSPWTDEAPAHYSLVDLVRMFGTRFSTRWLARADELGVLKVDGTRFRAPSPRMLQAGAELAKAGIPMDDLLEVVVSLRANVERAAEEMVLLVERHIVERYGDEMLPAEDMSQLGDLIWRLRPLVEMAVHAEVARAMEIAASSHLGDRLGNILEKMQHPPETTTATDAKPPRRGRRSDR